MALLLVALFVVVPAVEIYVLLQVGHAIGAPATVALLLADAALGAALSRREGRRHGGRCARPFSNSGCLPGKWSTAPWSCSAVRSC